MRTTTPLSRAVYGVLMLLMAWLVYGNKWGGWTSFALAVLLSVAGVAYLAVAVLQWVRERQAAPSDSTPDDGE